MSDKINNLEQTIMELGTELYRLRSDISTLREQSDGYKSTLALIKKILDEKEIMTFEDFEVLLKEHEMNSFEAESDLETEVELQKLKKISH